VDCGVQLPSGLCRGNPAEKNSVHSAMQFCTRKYKLLLNFS